MFQKLVFLRVEYGFENLNWLWFTTLSPGLSILLSSLDCLIDLRKAIVNVHVSYITFRWICKVKSNNCKDFHTYFPPSFLTESNKDCKIRARHKHDANTMKIAMSTSQHLEEIFKEHVHQTVCTETIRLFYTWTLFKTYSLKWNNNYEKWTN